jgi:hypothetical protein
MVATEISRLKARERAELVLDTGRTYDGIEPVCVRVTKRAGRYEFSDDGGAVAAAAVDVRGVAFPAAIALGRCSVNVSRLGVVWLPATGRASEEWLAGLPGLVAEGSVALYEALLDSDD